MPPPKLGERNQVQEGWDEQQQAERTQQLADQDAASPDQRARARVEGFKKGAGSDDVMADSGSVDVREISDTGVV